MPADDSLTVCQGSPPGLQSRRDLGGRRGSKEAQKSERANIDLAHARAAAHDAEEVMEAVSGFDAVLQRAQEHIAGLRNESLPEQIAGSRRTIEILRDDFEDAAERAKTHPTEWDHAGDKLIQARIDEARAKLRIRAEGVRQRITAHTGRGAGN